MKDNDNNKTFDVENSKGRNEEDKQGAKHDHLSELGTCQSVLEARSLGFLGRWMSEIEGHLYFLGVLVSSELSIGF